MHKTNFQLLFSGFGPDVTTIWREISLCGFIHMCNVQFEAIVTFASSLLCLSGGLTIGISAVLLPKLEEDEEFYWTKEYGSWIASIAPISSIFSCLCIGSLLDRFGRKSAHIMLSFPFIIGWLCMAFANDFYVMMVGRFFTGFSFGLGSGLAGAISYCLLSSSVKVTPDLLARGEPAMYGTFAIVTLISSVILYSLLPETHGKTLQAIEDSYNNKDRTTTL
ncbi:hypothetical protein MSG28_011478 [Choristoneura fumiferana]|uniref:Uncharacterized protein n=1 Tax=Choristoneura fumiferana TaxID=7141 RepID=A0ACC0JNA9_CHOFU|nr:hypothetical protein MSG28_011478 [Choristoneura fumiferana]